MLEKPTLVTDSIFSLIVYPKEFASYAISNNRIVAL